MRTLVLIDGQNLFRLARDAWAPDPPVPSSPYAWPSFDIARIAQAVTDAQPNRQLAETRFYTGVHTKASNAHWHHFWTNKLRHARNQGIHVYTGRINAGRKEKSVDVALAVDLVQATYEQRFDVAIIVSQDTDFGPAVRLCKQIAQAQGRTLRFECAFPPQTAPKPRRGIPGTIWTPITQAIYDACRDPRDYRSGHHSPVP